MQALFDESESSAPASTPDREAEEREDHVRPEEPASEDLKTDVVGMGERTKDVHDVRAEDGLTDVAGIDTARDADYLAAKLEEEAAIAKARILERNERLQEEAAASAGPEDARISNEGIDLGFLTKGQKKWVAAYEAMFVNDWGRMLVALSQKTGLSLEAAILFIMLADLRSVQSILKHYHDSRHSPEAMEAARRFEELQRRQMGFLDEAEEHMKEGESWKEPVDEDDLPQDEEPWKS